MRLYEMKTRVNATNKDGATVEGKEQKEEESWGKRAYLKRIMVLGGFLDITLIIYENEACPCPQTAKMKELKKRRRQGHPSSGFQFKTSTKSKSQNLTRQKIRSKSGTWHDNHKRNETTLQRQLLIG